MVGLEGGKMDKVKTKKKMSGKKKALITGISIVSVIVVILFIGLLVYHSYYSKLNFEPANDNKPTISDNDLPPEPDDNDGPDSSQGEINEADNNLADNNAPVKYSKDVFNILLIGIDSRQDNSRGRSDSMILVSINKKSKKIITTSIMRDCYVQIPGHQNNRINAAFAFGGPNLLIQTIENNFKVRIDRYAYINFFSFIDIVDSVNGVTLDVSEKEIPVINKYISQLNRLRNEPQGTDYLTVPGTLHLNGKQALGYARDRYVGHADFERTARQRRVLEQIVSKAKGLNPIQLSSMMNKILPNVTTNLSEGEVLSYVVGAPTYLKYEVEQFRIPMDNAYKGLRIRGMAVLDVDFNKNVTELQSRVFGGLGEIK